MNRRLVYSPISLLFAILLAALLIFVVSALFVGVLRTAFTRIGFSWDDALLLLLACLFGAGINLPLATLESPIPVVRDRYVRAFGVTYRIPVEEIVTNRTTLAINVGGAVIPTLVSLYLLWSFPAAFSYVVLATALVAAVTHAVARPVRGVGIVTPALLPPVAAALAAWTLVSIVGSAYQAPHEFVFVTAYAGGTLGTLIGADLLNLEAIKRMGAPVASIGGAGTFDGVFLTGIIAVLLV
ncbi:MAG TPA: DUF1614 domain-containing protein [Methanotrichaceae archaeon]|nr:MAG: hypothetical protein A4E47_00386 [Methanosaeta sp. PtaU1.Bin028]HOT07913.1 DUF1614 domain-containing protein [Methanotrichaceae archaeon]HQF17695.1 DUF1614 domain-containing protein [Methanotrichaceae archaeon]HQI92269.1 DUF1614 domain-containing protein [Methanotrichaceae archaeon]HQJ29401.1 DUF1614 domain-containing protein [Methanotrichaceae archaeon]